jgi:shikimate kinase
MKIAWTGKNVLIGFRGTGKSIIGKKLASSLGVEYVSTDDLIRQHFNLSITEIIEQYGWTLFRKKESEIIKSLKSKDNVVIDTGGGSILNNANRKNLKQNAIVIQLTAYKKDIYERITIGDDRPVLTSATYSKKVSMKREIAELIESRKELYNSISDITINTSKNDIKKTIRIIFKHIKGLV